MSATVPVDPEFAHDVRDGLTSEPKAIPPRWLYDARGSALFEAITELPEYYLTRTERAIFEASAPAMVAACPSPVELVELGAGSAAKTRVILEAVVDRQGPTTYCPVDISAAAIDMATRQIGDGLPDVTVRPVVGRYVDALEKIREVDAPARLVLFIGSSIGNFQPAEQERLLRRFATAMRPQDRFLLGTDMAKDVAVLEPAYDDARGVTAQFTTNLLARMNRELAADFDLDAFAHRARFNADKSCIEIHLESLADQEVRIEALDLDVHFDEGELLHTEDSYKFSEAMLDRIVTSAGFARERSWYDERKWFGVHLLRVR